MKTEIDIDKDIQALSFIESKVSMPNMAVPQGYFEALAPDMVNTVHTNDFISSLPKTNVFEVPPSYFEKLPSRLISQVNTTKIVPLRPAFFLFKNLAIAASILFILGIGLFTFYQKSTTIKANTDLLVSQRLDTISDTDIENYVATNDLETEFDIDNTTQPLPISNVNVTQFEQDILLNSINETDLKQLDINTL